MESFVEVPSRSYIDAVKSMSRDILLNEVIFLQERYTRDLMAANFKIVRLEKELVEQLTT